MKGRLCCALYSSMGLVGIPFCCRIDFIVYSQAAASGNACVQHILVEKDTAFHAGRYAVAEAAEKPAVSFAAAYAVRDIFGNRASCHRRGHAAEHHRDCRQLCQYAGTRKIRISV